MAFPSDPPEIKKSEQTKSRRVYTRNFECVFDGVFVSMRVSRAIRPPHPKKHATRTETDEADCYSGGSQESIIRSFIPPFVRAATTSTLVTGTP